ncbi:MAG: 4Fe-4S binding protein, partial [Eggerthellaceae bacterium]|nr:4Fe-4S binding protein [Eggerthellaceae bacterium]
GRGKPGDIELLERIGRTMQDASLCALGRTAPNPVMTTIKFFRDEYEAHINEQTCPAGVCAELTQFAIEAGACTGCGLCSRACPAGAISGDRKAVHVIDPAKCIACGSCREACRFNAVLTERRSA